MKCTDNALFNVLFVDNHVLACVKTPGMPTQTHRAGEESLEERAKAWVKGEFNKPGRVFLHAVHRLDKRVGGIVLFARTSKALSRLQKMVREKRWKKVYFAVVEGVPREREATLKHELVHGEFRAHVKKGGKPSELHYRVVREGKGRALLEVDLITGRYHQIRAQLAAIGHPIVGDEKYGATMRWEGPGVGLWHEELHFEHPVSKEVICLKAPWDNCPF